MSPVVKVELTMTYQSQPCDIFKSIPPRPDPVPDAGGNLIFEVEQILGHQKKGRGFQCLTLMKGFPQNYEQWQPTRDVFYSDGTLTAVFFLTLPRKKDCSGIFGDVNVNSAVGDILKEPFSEMVKSNWKKGNPSRPIGL